jgi:hypothetical protein
MSSGEEESLLKPIVNASYPATLTALSLAVLQITGRENLLLDLTLALTALLFLLSAFFIFFYTLYHRRRWLWVCTAITFLSGLSGSLVSVLLLLVF